MFPFPVGDEFSDDEFAPRRKKSDSFFDAIIPRRTLPKPEPKKNVQSPYTPQFLRRIGQRDLRPHIYRPLQSIVKDALENDIGFVPTCLSLSSSSASNASASSSSQNHSSDSDASVLTQLDRDRLAEREGFADTDDPDHQDHQDRGDRPDCETATESVLSLDSDDVDAVFDVRRGQLKEWQHSKESRDFKRLVHIQEFEEVRKVFAYFDRLGSGFVEGRQLGVMLRSLGQFYSFSDIEALWLEFPKDSKVGLKTFARVVARRFAEVPDGRRLKEAFETFARQDSVSVRDLGHALTRLGDKLSDKQWQALVSVNEGFWEKQNMSFADFAELFMGPPEWRFPLHFRSIT